MYFHMGDDVPCQTTWEPFAILADMNRRAYIADSIGERIRQLRQTRGWTQTELAERVGTTKRSIIHYEMHGKYPPAPILAALSGAFQISMEALMAPDAPEQKRKRDEPNLLNDPEDRRLWKRMQQIKKLPERDRRAVLRMLDTIAGKKSAAS